MKQKHLKSNFEREKDLTQNLTILWATIMGQCTPALLQEEVHGATCQKCSFRQRMASTISTEDYSRSQQDHEQVLLGFQGNEEVLCNTTEPNRRNRRVLQQVRECKRSCRSIQCGYCRSHFASSIGAKVRNKGDRYAKVSCRFTHHERQQSQV